MNVSETPVAAAREPQVTFDDDSGGGYRTVTVVNPPGSQDVSPSLGSGSGKPHSLQLPIGGSIDSGRRVAQRASSKR